MGTVRSLINIQPAVLDYTQPQIQNGGILKRVVSSIYQLRDDAVESRY